MGSFVNAWVFITCFVIRREQFVQFVDNMEGPQTPSWLGLPNNAEKVLLTTLGMFHLPVLSCGIEMHLLAQFRSKWCACVHSCVN